MRAIVAVFFVVVVVAGADPYRTSPGLETPLSLLRKWASADPKGEAAVRAIAKTWEENGGADGAGAAADHDDDDDGDEGEGEGEGDAEDARARDRAQLGGSSAMRASGEDQDKGERGGKSTAPKRERDVLDADRIEIDQLYTDQDDVLRRRYEGALSDSDNGSDDEGDGDGANDEDSYDEDD